MRPLGSLTGRLTICTWINVKPIKLQRSDSSMKLKFVDGWVKLFNNKKTTTLFLYIHTLNVSIRIRLVFHGEYK